MIVIKGTKRQTVRILGWMVCIAAMPLFGCGTVINNNPAPAAPVAPVIPAPVAVQPPPPPPVLLDPPMIPGPVIAQDPLMLPPVVVAGAPVMPVPPPVMAVPQVVVPPAQTLVAPRPAGVFKPVIKTVVKNKGKGPVNVNVVNVLADGSNVAGPAVVGGPGVLPPAPQTLVAPPAHGKVKPIIKTVVRNRGKGPVNVEVVNVIAEGSNVASR